MNPDEQARRLVAALRETDTEPPSEPGPTWANLVRKPESF